MQENLGGGHSTPLGRASVNVRSTGEINWYDFGKGIEECSPVVQEEVEVAKGKEIQNWQDKQKFQIKDSLSFRVAGDSQRE